MAKHFMTLCRHCSTIISQCRCPDPNKEVRFDTCAACTNKIKHGCVSSNAVVSYAEERISYLEAENARLRGTLRKISELVNEAI